MNLGYACINQTLSNCNPKITTNRSMIKKTFLAKGKSYASALSLLNCYDLIKILKWNKENNIKFFRLSSDIFPWASHYNFCDLPDYDEIKKTLFKAGLYAKKNNIRLTAHPGPFNVLVSPNDNVVKNTIIDLSNHGEMFDLLTLERTQFNKINIHCNGVYGDKISAMNRFCKNFQKLPLAVSSRLTVENDDKPSMYSVKDLMYIYDKIGIPIVFDFHHHKFCDGGLSEKQALKLALSTWPKNIKPVVHYSESKSLHESNPNIKLQAHSDYIENLPNTFGYNVDIMIEAKAKELSILPFLEKK
ncbi:MAG: UV damage repair endonuclease UvsE [Flavobacteriales bacterium]|nr:UV damage repair endonuclease UvsE [Flavobacteriales bacterium]|tara:strand:+ start:20940 stop:21845 length:906 start_codon:yes stop_codon:yes gene_type:complete